MRVTIRASASVRVARLGLRPITVFRPKSWYLNLQIGLQLDGLRLRSTSTDLWPTLLIAQTVQSNGSFTLSVMWL